MAKQDLILLALDASPIQDLMSRTLHAAGFEVAVTHEQDGLKRSMQEAIPALIILGRVFAGQDGISISQELLERFPTLPIILYADEDKPELAKMILKAGLSDYLYPPLKMDDISAAVTRSLKRARQLGDWLRREVKRTTSSLAERPRSRNPSAPSLKRSLEIFKMV